MTCVHLQQLYQLCQDHKLKISSAELVHIVCPECNEKEICPSVLTDEYDADHPEEIEQRAASDEDD